MVEELNNQFTIVMSKMETQLDSLTHLTKTLEEDITKLTTERDELGVAPHKLPKGRIVLDVGGCLFSTTFETLTKIPDSYLEKMFSGRFPIKVNEDGHVFVDRDGTHFDSVLKFLRDPTTKIKMKEKLDFDEFKAEIEFYGLTRAMFGDLDSTIPDTLDWIDNKKLRFRAFLRN